MKLIFLVVFLTSHTNAVEIHVPGSNTAAEHQVLNHWLNNLPQSAVKKRLQGNWVHTPQGSPVDFVRGNQCAEVFGGKPSIVEANQKYLNSLKRHLGPTKFPQNGVLLVDTGGIQNRLSTVSSLMRKAHTGRLNDIYIQNWLRNVKPVPLSELVGPGQGFFGPDETGLLLDRNPFPSKGCSANSAVKNNALDKPCGCSPKLKMGAGIAAVLALSNKQVQNVMGAAINKIDPYDVSSGAFQPPSGPGMGGVNDLTRIVMGAAYATQGALETDFSQRGIYTPYANGGGAFNPLMEAVQDSTAYNVLANDEVIGWRGKTYAQKWKEFKSIVSSQCEMFEWSDLW